MKFDDKTKKILFILFIYIFVFDYILEKNKKTNLMTPLQAQSEGLNK